MGTKFKKQLIFILLSAFLGSFILGLWQFFRFNDGRLHLVFCDVGQGDAIYIKAPNGREALIDGGPDDRVLDCLSSHRPFFDRKIDVVILTHPEADHLRGLISVLERYKVDYLVVENIFPDSAVFAEFRRLVVKGRPTIYNPKAGDRLRLGNAQINFFWPREVVGEKKTWFGKGGLEKMGSLNKVSLILEIKYGDFTSLQTGDAESPVLEQALPLPEGIGVLKVPHHGSKQALSREILKVLRPQLAVISVGRGNHFGHPTPETLKLLKDFGILTLRTDQKGEVEIISDGRGWKVN